MKQPGVGRWDSDTAPRPAALQPCGTEAAHRRHLRHGEKPCEPCAKANRDRVYMSQYGTLERRLNNPAKCGTIGGYNRHLRLGEPTCLPCRRANTDYAMALYRRRAGRPVRVKPRNVHV